MTGKKKGPSGEGGDPKTYIENFQSKNNSRKEAASQRTITSLKYDMNALANKLATIKVGFSDVGNGQRLARLFGRDIHFCPQLNGWIIWNGITWRWDELGKIFWYAKTVIRALHIVAGNEKDDRLREAIAQWARASESDAHVKAMVNQAKTEPGIPLAPCKLDADPMLLGVQDGVIDLSSGKLRHPNRLDLITKQAAVVYEDGADCPIWQRFLATVTDGDEDLMQFLQNWQVIALPG